MKGILYIEKPTYLIAELDGDVVPVVNELRERFNPGCLLWPIDITIAGSSGIGTVKEGQVIDEVIEILTPIIAEYGFREVEFKAISRFPNTGIYHLVPGRHKFDVLHNAVADSDILFNENSWPYNPHCTLRAGRTPIEECDALFETISIPKNVTVECFSLYQPESEGGVRLHRF